MRVACVSAVVGMLLSSTAAAGSDPLMGIPTNTNIVTTKEKDDSTGNLLGRTDFFVCSSFIGGMDGHYVLYEDANFQSDRGTPVFAREDDSDDQMGRSVAAVGQGTPESDFRLFRRHGFWMFADIASWPPTTHFRCDPTKSHVPGVDFAGVCGMNLATPPLFGYSAVDAEHAMNHLVLRTGGCNNGDDAGSGLERVVLVQTNLSERKDEL